MGFAVNSVGACRTSVLICVWLCVKAKARDEVEAACEAPAEGQ